eukprot:CAMPEP_0171164034 /NCGR_PEP_ID=MMETSP0790-20130122/5461_1 /TAXON_ID=2925 /ORGANISM="Alexandrium catenella, Strain OF101" /LENGTH=334 /DNA_ID=CAMNT_0011628779 /DNA_START=93 /DNA_END=1097 /DNA_ORIENTATION=+
MGTCSGLASRALKAAAICGVFGTALGIRSPQLAAEQQQQAAAGSSRQQQLAAGSSRQQQAAANISWQEPAAANISWQAPAANASNSSEQQTKIAAEPDLPDSLPTFECNCPDGHCVPRFRQCVADKRARAARNCGGRCQVVFVGDSGLERMNGGHMCLTGTEAIESGEAYQEAFGDRHPSTLNLGGSCDQTQQTLYVLDEVLPVLEAPLAFFVLVGTNNLGHNGEDHALRGIRAVLDRLLDAHPTSKVLLHPLLPRGQVLARVNALNDMLPELVSNLSSSGARVQMVDCGHTLGAPKFYRQNFDWMQIHPTPKAYRKFLACVGPEIDRATASGP